MAETDKAALVLRYQYLVEDHDASMPTTEINDHCNQMGHDGWRLIHIGTTVRTAAQQDFPAQVRLWWMR